MARGKKKVFVEQAPEEKPEVLEVVASTVEIEEEEKVKTVSSGDDMVVIATCLSHGLEFDDVPNGYGGTKKVVFPSINAHLVGKPEGVLVDGGRAVAVRIPRKDWEAIKRMHGREAAFVCNPPCLYEYGTIENFNKDVDGVIKYMKTGLEAEDPAELGVQEVENER